MAGTPNLITAPLGVRWTGAALTADGLALPGSARAARRRTAAMSALLGTGAAAAAGAALAPVDVPAAQAAVLLLFGARAVAAATVVPPRLRRLGRGRRRVLAGAGHTCVARASSDGGAPAGRRARTGRLRCRGYRGGLGALRHSRLAEPALLPVHSIRLASASLFTGGRSIDGQP